MQLRRQWFNPIFSLLLPAAAILFSVFFLRAHYCINDDLFIIHVLKSGSSFVPFCGELITAPLCFLYSRLPQIPWFGIAQMLLLLISFAVINRSLFDIASRQNCHPVFAAAVCIGIAVCAQLYVCTFVTYTTTAGALLAAAAAKLLSLDSARRSFPSLCRGYAVSLVLILLSWSLRLAIFPIALIFLLLTFFLSLLTHSFRRETFFLTLGAAAVFVFACVLRIARENLPDVAAYMDFNSSRGQVMDYALLGFSALSGESLSRLGLDETTRALALKWCFLPSEITADAFRSVYESLQEGSGGFSFDRAAEILRTFFQLLVGISENLTWWNRWSLRLCTVFAGFSLFSLFFGEKRFQRFLCWLGISLVYAAALCYLIYEGRYPFRALYCAVLPPLCCYACLLLGSRAKLPHLTHSAVIAVSCWLCLSAAVPLSDVFYSKAADDTVCVPVTQFASEHPDELILYDQSLVDCGLSIFSENAPQCCSRNVLFYGGWDFLSPSNTRLFSRYGIDLRNRQASDFVDGPVIFAATTLSFEAQDAVKVSLLDYFETRLGVPVQISVVEEAYGITFFRFVTE